ncbi:ankyrin repeat-containing domain protein [Pelagophyceae sp. CCMP2097]|nr:ankyrin repeat-containing domain protein [Pelagophyceae sp. CCMP2097]
MFAEPPGATPAPTRLMKSVQLGSVFAVLGIAAAPKLIKELPAWTVAQVAAFEKRTALKFGEFRTMWLLVARLRQRPGDAWIADAAGDDKALPEHRRIFDEFDADGSGLIEIGELAAALAACGGGDEDLAAQVAVIEAGLTHRSSTTFLEFIEIVGKDASKATPENVVFRALKLKHRALKDSERATRTGTSVALTLFGDATLDLPKVSGALSRHDVCARLARAACVVAGGAAEDGDTAMKASYEATQRVVDNELLAACMKNKKVEVEHALKAGASPNARRTVAPHRSALLCCCDAGSDVDVPLQILAAGADPNICDDDGITALMLASRGSATSEATGLVARLISAGDANAKSRDGTSALHYAAAFGRTTAVRALLEAGAEANAATNDAVLPLMVAAKAGHARCAELLLEYGADPRTRDRRKISAGDLASRFEYPQLADLLNAAAEMMSDAAPVGAARGGARTPGRRSSVGVPQLAKAASGDAAAQPRRPATLQSNTKRTAKASLSPGGRRVSKPGAAQTAAAPSRANAAATAATAAATTPAE